jgi:hypothetical protein
MNPHSRSKHMRMAAYERQFAPPKPKPREVAPEVDRKVCESKRRHCDEVTARAVGSVLLGEPGEEKRVLYTYRCTCCNGWHLTRRPNGFAITAATTVEAPPVGALPTIEQVVAMAVGARITSYFDCEHGDDPVQTCIHRHCLTLESQGRAVRHRVHARSIIWKIKE